MMGYLSRDKVIGFLAHPTLALLKWQATSVRMCLIYHFQETKRRLSKKRRTVKTNAVQGIQKSHKCLAKVAQKGNHLFFWTVWATSPPGVSSQDCNIGSLVTRKRSTCFYDFCSCVFNSYSVFYSLFKSAITQKVQRITLNLFAVLFHFESTNYHNNICFVFNLLKSVLSRNGIAIAVGNS